MKNYPHQSYIFIVAPTVWCSIYITSQIWPIFQSIFINSSRLDLFRKPWFLILLINLQLGSLACSPAPQGSKTSERASSNASAFSALIYRYTEMLNSNNPNFLDLMHPHNTARNDPTTSFTFTLSQLGFLFEVSNVSLLEHNNNEGKARVLLKVGSGNMAMEKSAIGVLRNDAGIWKIANDGMPDTGDRELASQVMTGAICATIDSSTQHREVIERIRTKFGKIASDRLSPEQQLILYTMVAGAAIVLDRGKSSNINLRQEIKGQVAIDEYAIMRSRFATKVLLSAFVRMLPELQPHLSVLSINDSYLVVIVYKNSKSRRELLGFDICHPENVYVEVDATYRWVKTRYKDVRNCSLDDRSVLETILPPQ